MGAIGVVDWDKIWEVYETPKDLRRNARKTVRGYWYVYLEETGRPKEFPWQCLSEREQDDFIYCIIYDTMMTYYVSYEAATKVARKVQNLVANLPQTADNRIQASNDAINNLYRDHWTGTHSEAEKKKAYDELCRDIQAFNKNIPLPTYKEFEKRLFMNAAVCPGGADYEARVRDMEMVYRNIRVYKESLAGGVARNDAEARAEDRANAEAAVRAEDEKKANRQPIRAYDYVRDYEDTMLNPMLQVDGATEVYVKIILKVLEEKLGLKVDYNLIDECLLCKAEFWEYLRKEDIDLDDYEESSIEYDENIGMSREEHEKFKKKYAAYLSCQKKLDDLKPLYKYEK